jgi:hypothetical protein
MRPPYALMLLLATACPKPEPVVDDTGAEADTDTDSDADSDTDADADSDADTDADSDADTDTGDTGEEGYRWAHLDPFVQPSVWVEPYPLEPGGTATVHYEGALSKAHSLVLHHGFNGWNEVQGLDDLTDTWLEYDYLWERDSEMVRDGHGAHEVTITLPTDGRALHFAIYDPVGDVWDNNGERDWGFSFEMPYLGPYLTYSDVVQPHNGVVVNFETALPCLGVVEYGTTEALGTAAVGSAFGTLHHIALEGLASDTDYYYKLWDAAGNGSEIFGFHTASATSSELSFVVLSDMQDTGEFSRWGEVAASVLSDHPDLAFAMLAGDMINEVMPGQWWTFFDRGRDLFTWLPIFTAIGNHDTPTFGPSSDTSEYLRYFAPPSAADGVGNYYSADFGAVHLLVLNSDDEAGFVQGTGDQYLFAQQDLAATWSGGVREPDWVFGMWHVPGMNAGSRHQDQQGGYRDITELFEGNLDWAFFGHEHLYQRMVPLEFNANFAGSGNYGIGPDDGVGYIVTPPAGNWTHDQLVGPDHEDANRRDRVAFPEVDPESAFVATEIGYITVDLTATSLHLRTWGMGTIDKPVPTWMREEYSYTR